MKGVGAEISVLSDWLNKLESEGSKIVGVWEQGSRVLGYADEDSDRDYIVVWDGKYPSAKERSGVAVSLGAKVHESSDIESSRKGLDMLENDGQLINVAHLNGEEFFVAYQGLVGGSEEYVRDVYRIGGFVAGEIVYDSGGRLGEHRKKLDLSDEIIENVRNRLLGDLGYELKQLEIAMRRKSMIMVVYQMGEVMHYLHLWQYMREREWVISEKWFMRVASDRGWRGSFVDFVEELEEGEKSVEELARWLIEIAGEWGFMPTEEIRA